MKDLVSVVRFNRSRNSLSKLIFAITTLSVALVPTAEAAESNNFNSKLMCGLAMENKYTQIQKLIEKLDTAIPGKNYLKDTFILAIAKHLRRKEKRQGTLATFAFVGGPGTGKVTTAQQLAEVINGNPDAIRSIDASKIQSWTDLNTLFEPPVGMVSSSHFERIFTSEKFRLATNPDLNANVVVVENIEQSGPELRRILESGMSLGAIETGSNDKIDLSDTIVILTSGLIDSKVNPGAMDGNPHPSKINSTVEFLNEQFPNKIDKVFLFGSANE